MIAHALLNILTEFGKMKKMREMPSILYYFRNEFINSIIQEYEC